MLSPAAKSRAPGSCRRRRRGERHRRPRVTRHAERDAGFHRDHRLVLELSSDQAKARREDHSGRRDARCCSRRVPERMAERVAGIGAWDAEDQQALVSAISYDDPRVARVPIPLERDRETSVLAYVEFHKHDWLLPGFGHSSVEMENT
jgi:hypothetical protein